MYLSCKIGNIKKSLHSNPRVIGDELWMLIHGIEKKSFKTYSIYKEQWTVDFNYSIITIYIFFCLQFTN